MMNVEAKIIAKIDEFTAALKKAAKSLNQLERVWFPSNHEWSATMAERIDDDNAFHDLSPMFYRRIEDIPNLMPVFGVRGVMFDCVTECFESIDDIQLRQHLNFKPLTVAQMRLCGFAIDYEDEDGHVNFSRWLAADLLQLCRIEFL